MNNIFAHDEEKAALNHPYYVCFEKKKNTIFLRSDHIKAFARHSVHIVFSSFYSETVHESGLTQTSHTHTAGCYGSSIWERASVKSAELFVRNKPSRGHLENFNGFFLLHVYAWALAVEPMSAETFPDTRDTLRHSSTSVIYHGTV